MPHRTYTEEEVAALFNRAAEMQVHGHRPDGRAGLTLEEVAAIAADAGLDPEHVRLAASELERPARRRKAETRVTSSEIVAERWVQGHLDDDAREDLVAELRHLYDDSSWEAYGMGSHGKSTVQTIGRSIEWQHTNPWYGTRRRVLIQPRQYGVRIRVAQSNPYSGTATGWTPMYAPMVALFAGFIAAPATGSWLIGIAIALGLLIVLTPLMTAMTRRSRDRHRGQVEELADSIAGHVVPSHAPGRAGERVAHDASDVRIEPGLEIPDAPEPTDRVSGWPRMRER